MFNLFKLLRHPKMRTTLKEVKLQIQIFVLTLWYVSLKIY